MGTTLTGTKPKDTYDSLIKVTDNGPISGTAKYLSDGLGNDLPIAVSTSNVGIGTSAPVSKLNVDGSITATGGARTNPTGGGSIVLDYQTTGDLQGRVRSRDWDGALWKNITLEGANIIAAPSGTEVGRFTSNGLTFNGDTAAANALDDYEEGTWTPRVFDDANGGNEATYTQNEGVYTKIGNMVYWRISISLGSKGSMTAGNTLYVRSFPFTSATIPSNWFNPTTALTWGATFADYLVFHQQGGTTFGYLYEVTSGGNGGGLFVSDYTATAVINASGFYRV